MKTLSAILYYLALTGVIALAVLLFATKVPVFGPMQAKIVQSGSMEPTIHTGALVLITPADSYAVGDIVTFGPDTSTQIPTTHRLVATSGSGAAQVFTTQGDANEDPDSLPISVADIHGKVRMNIPYLGYVLDFARQPLGFVALVGIPAILIISEELSKIYRELKNNRRNRTAHVQDQTHH